jgi:hypothetical protein
MPQRHRRTSAPRTARGRPWGSGAVAALAAASLFVSAAAAQGPPKKLTVAEFLPGGARTSVTEGWTRLEFHVTNPTDTDRRALVLVFYAGRSDVQYGRELWVPAHATVASWLPMGPAPPESNAFGRDIQILVHDVTEGKGQLLLPRTEERIRALTMKYRKRESTTAVVTDVDADEGPGYGQLPQPPSPADEVVTLARVFRSVRDQSDFVQVLDINALPPWPKAFDGIDQLVLASDRACRDPAGMQALRHWLEQGGCAWVMLDRVAPEALAPVLGEALDFHVVGRVSLTDFRVERHPPDPVAPPPAPQRHERAVDFVRVQLPGGEAPRHTIDGWPVWFTRGVGRGTVVFTTLGPRGWYRPRTAGDSRSPYSEYPTLPVANDTLAVATEGLLLRSAVAAYPVEAFEGLLTQEIGYAVVSRTTVALVFGVFLLGTLGLHLLARRTRRPELLGWVGPAVALGAAGVLVLAGEWSRRAAPPTAAFAQVVDAVNGTDEAAVEGLMAVYRPDSGPVSLGAGGGGFFDLDMAGIEGQTRRLVLTDQGAWHWENLVLPAGVRFAPFQFTARTGAPITAVARFGPAGAEGDLTAKSFTGLGDGLLTSADARNLAVRLRPDGAFSAGTDDALAPGQFVAGAILTDLQQRRQEVYRRFLKRSPGETDVGHTLLAWAEPVATPFELAPGTRVAGTALLTVPLRLERPAPGTRVTIPGAFMTLRRALDDQLVPPALDSNLGSDQHLRFQLPAAVLPMEVERARLLAKINARTRTVTVAGQADGGFVELYRAENPLGPFQVELTEQRFLRLDAQGGLHVRVTVSELPKATAKELAKGTARGTAAPPAAVEADPTWAIEYLELEVVGRTPAKG